MLFAEHGEVSERPPGEDGEGRPSVAVEPEEVLRSEVTQLTEEVRAQEAAMSRGQKDALRTPAASPRLDETDEPDGFELPEVVIEALPRELEAASKAARGVRRPQGGEDGLWHLRGVGGLAKKSKAGVRFLLEDWVLVAD